jgi:hypothetical protein
VSQRLASPAQQAWLTARQRALGRIAYSEPRSPREYRLCGCWWKLESLRGYDSSPASARYARNMFWAAELASEHGPAPWLDLLKRARVKNPEAAK